VYVAPDPTINANGFTYSSDPMKGGTAESQFGNGTPWAIAAANSMKALTKSKGGIIPQYLSSGDTVFKAIGTDTVPAMLTPGEFVMSKYAVDNFGLDNMRAINNGTFSGTGGVSSVYNSYDLNVNVRSDANPNEIARVVMSQIRSIDSQRVRGVRI
jgi:hypothetical protein